jgi:hypothetical protein
VVVGSLREAHDGSDCRGAFGFEPPAARVVTASLSMKATNYITRTVDRTSQPGGYAIPSDRVEISWPDGGFPTPPRGAKVVTMTATPEQLAESTTHKAERGDIRAPHSGASTRIHRVAAGVGIIVGGVVIAGAIFLFGLLIGSQWSAGWDQGGGGEAGATNGTNPPKTAVGTHGRLTITDSANRVQRAPPSNRARRRRRHLVDSVCEEHDETLRSPAESLHTNRFERLSHRVWLAVHRTRHLEGVRLAGQRRRSSTRRGLAILVGRPT